MPMFRTGSFCRAAKKSETNTADLALLTLNASHWLAAGTLVLARSFREFDSSSNSTVKMKGSPYVLVKSWCLVALLSAAPLINKAASAVVFMFWYASRTSNQVNLSEILQKWCVPPLLSPVQPKPGILSMLKEFAWLYEKPKGPMSDGALTMEEMLFYHLSK